MTILTVTALAVFSGCLSDNGSARSSTALTISIKPPSSLDPVFLRDSAGTLIARQIYEPLVRFDPDSSRLTPGLASTWEMLDDGARFVFHLRDGAKFHNGRAVNSDDVKFSLNRLVRKATGSETSFLLDSVIGFDKVNTTGESQELEGLSAIDDKTVEFRLRSPWVDFPYVLTSPSTAPIPRAEFEADPAAFENRPLGSGPYQLTAPLEPGRNIVLGRFLGYRGARLPIKRVEFAVYDDLQIAWKDFEDKKLDVTEVPPGRISFAEARYGEAGFSPLAAALFVAFNTRDADLADPRLREAVSRAIDRVAIARNVYSDTMVPANGLVPFGIAGRAAASCGHLCVRDVDGAKALLSETYPGGGVPPLSYDYPAGGVDEAVGKALQSQLSEVGIELRLRPRERELHAFFDLLESGQHEMFRLAWPAEYPLADWFVSPLFRTGSPDNHTGFANADFDQRISAARTTKEASNRLGLYSELETAAMQSLVVIPIGFFRNRQVVDGRVEGFYVDQTGAFDISRLRIREP